MNPLSKFCNFIILKPSAMRAFFCPEQFIIFESYFQTLKKEYYEKSLLIILSDKDR